MAPKEIMMYCTAILLVYLLGGQVVAGVIVSVSGDSLMDLGEDARQTCHVSEKFSSLAWMMSSFRETNIRNAITIFTVNDGVVTYSAGSSLLHYDYDNSQGKNALIVNSFTYEDEGRYWCLVTFVSEGISRHGSIDVRVREPQILDYNVAVGIPVSIVLLVIVAVLFNLLIRKPKRSRASRQSTSQQASLTTSQAASLTTSQADGDLAIVARDQENDETISQSVNLSASQLNDRQRSQVAIESVSQPTNRPVSHSTVQQEDRQGDQLATHSISQPTNQRDSQPTGGGMSQTSETEYERPNKDYKWPKLQHLNQQPHVLDEIELDVKHPANHEKGNVTYANVPHAHKALRRNQLKFVKELGRGAFGLVFLAEATGIKGRPKAMSVAVKTLKEGATDRDKADMKRELDLMKLIPDHPNIVQLLGFCSEQDPPYIIVEYLPRGNLKDLLLDSRSKDRRIYANLHGISKSLTSKDLMGFAKNVADGMEFISSQQCIHRDLAARNVLVAEDMTCKVSDFGFARDVMNIRVYQRKSEGNLPLRWMALESLLDDVYTTESDVWSYGVLLWEIVALGARPYPGMDSKMMLDMLQCGYRMPRPRHCQDKLYQLMLRCWQEDPWNRPTFTRISEELSKMMDDGKECISIKDYEESAYEVTCPRDEVIWV